jgi:O-antigen/teichoic acid export membrane protein
MILKNVFWAGLQQWGQQGSQVAALFVVARLIGPEAIGVMAIGNLLIMLAQIFINQGYAESHIQAQEITPSYTNSIFWRMMMGAAAFVFVYTISALCLVSFETEAKLGLILLALAPSLLLRPNIQIQTALAARDMRFKEVAKRSALSSFLGDGLALFLAFQGLGIWSLVVGLYLKALTLNFFLRDLNEWKCRFEYDTDCIRHANIYSRPLLKTNALSFVALRADQLMVGSVLGFEVLGVYSLAMRLMLMIEALLMSSLNRVLFSVFARLQEKDRLLELYFAVQNILCFSIFPAFAGIAIIGPTLFTHLLGEEWAQSGTILWPLAVFMVLKAASYLFYPLQLGMGRTDLLFYSTGVSCSLALAFSFGMVWYGVVAVAIGVALRALCSCIVHLFFIKKTIFFPTRDFIGVVVFNLLNTTVMCIAVYIVIGMTDHFHWVVMTGLSTICGVIIYALLNFWTQRVRLRQQFSLLKHWKT